ncbi:MAG: GNAT family N-acetyltransferase [Aeromicrobium sp.]
MTLEIRRIAPEEYDEVGELIVNSYGHNDYLTMPDGRFDGAYADELRATAERDASAELWLAVDDDELLGCVTWCPIGSPHRDLAVSDSQGEFRTLAVAPSARGRGTGRALVEFCLDRARRDGLTEVVLCSLPEMTPAHTLYESLGFVRRPDLDWHPVEGLVLWGFSLSLVD